VAEESQHGRLLNVDQLLVLQYLLEHVELDIPTAARLCQRDEPTARDILSRMETQLGYIERGGTGCGTYWTLRPHLHRQLAGPGHPERDRRIDWEAAKTRVLSVLKQKCKRDEQGLTNADIRQLTHYDRGQVKRLMSELQGEGTVQPAGKGRAAHWILRAGDICHE
jgi:ATP-dependent DNA helicase RecG